VWGLFIKTHFLLIIFIVCKLFVIFLFSKGEALGHVFFFFNFC
jgi:hypothetical protein